jgi:hypothetical protein
MTLTSNWLTFYVGSHCIILDCQENGAYNISSVVACWFVTVEVWVFGHLVTSLSPQSSSSWVAYRRVAVSFSPRGHACHICHRLCEQCFSFMLAPTLPLPVSMLYRLHSSIPNGLGLALQFASSSLLQTTHLKLCWTLCISFTYDWGDYPVWALPL